MVFNRCQITHSHMYMECQKEKQRRPETECNNQQYQRRYTLCMMMMTTTTNDDDDNFTCHIQWLLYKETVGMLHMHTERSRKR